MESTLNYREGNGNVLAPPLTFTLCRENTGGLAQSCPFSAPCECSIEIVWHSRQVVMTTLTIVSGDYWNVSVAVHAQGGRFIRQQNYCMLNNFLTMRILPIHHSHTYTHTHTHTHTVREHPLLFLMLFYSHRSKGEGLIIHTLGQNKLLHRLPPAWIHICQMTCNSELLAGKLDTQPAKKLSKVI